MGDGSSAASGLWTYTSPLFGTNGVFATNMQVSKPSGGLGSLTPSLPSFGGGGAAPAHACNTVYKEKTKQGTALRHDRNVFPLEGAPKKSSEGQNEDKCWGKAVS